MYSKYINTWNCASRTRNALSPRPAGGSLLILSNNYGLAWLILAVSRPSSHAGSMKVCQYCMGHCLLSHYSIYLAGSNKAATLFMVFFDISTKR